MIKQAYECYSLTESDYPRRLMHGHSWTLDGAHTLGKNSKQQFHVSGIHVIEINGRWHRLGVMPIDNLTGDPSEAGESRIASGDLPYRAVPSIFAQTGEGQGRRMRLDLEQSIDALAQFPAHRQCTLYTLRIGALKPLTFRIHDLLNDEATQMRVARWLKHEIDFRIEYKGQHEAA